MNFKSYSVYDEEDFFEKYNAKRAKGKSPNELIEQPIINELLGNVEGKQILDLGCGDGKYGLTLLSTRGNLLSWHGRLNKNGWISQRKFKTSKY